MVTQYHKRGRCSFCSGCDLDKGEFDENYFGCGDRICIDKNKYCDAHLDCFNEEDEGAKCAGNTLITFTSSLSYQSLVRIE